MSLATSPEPSKENITYIRQISPDNYKKQGIDFTQKALLELKEQMKNFKPKKHSIFEKDTETETESNDLDNINDCENTNTNDSNSESESDYDMTDKGTNIKLIIKNVKKDKKISNKLTPNKSTSNKSTSNKSTSNKSTSKITDKSLDIENAMLKQFERDNKKVLELKSICKKMDSDLHYLKLDLINSQCDKDILEKEVKFYKNKIEYIDKIIKFDNEKYIKEKKYLKYLKIFIILLLALNLYLYYFKYFMFVIGMCFLYFTK